MRLRKLQVFGVAMAWLMAPPTASAGELGVWGDLTVVLVESERLSWTATGSFRSEDESGGVGRLGGDLTTHLGSGVSLTGALLAIKTLNESESGFSWDRRLTAKVSYPLPWVRFRHLTGSTLYERHFRSGSADFNRYRQRFVLEWKERKFSPWLYQDFSFENDRGFTRSRSRLGVAWELRKHRRLKVGYQFQSVKRGTGWEPQHAVVLHFWFGRTFIYQGRDRKEETQE